MELATGNSFFDFVKRRLRRTSLVLTGIPVPGTIAATVIVVVIVLATYFTRRNRCPRRDPLCRPNKPCLQCYRDLYNGHIVKPDVD